MKTLCILALAGAAFLCAGTVRAESLDDAHRAFAAGHFHESTLGYQAILAQQGYSAPVLFDLGNSFYREADYPNAILAYRRAQWLEPNDPDIAANLQLAQKQAGVAIMETGWPEKIGGILSASGWAWIGSAAWILLCAGLLARAVWPQKRGLLSLSNAAAGFVLAAAIAAAVISSDKLHEAVIIDKKALALISPFPAAQVVFSPAAGDTVTIEKAYDDFLLVKDAAGHTGWVNKTQATPILPVQAARPS